MGKKLNEILGSSNRKLEIFSSEQIEKLESSIFEKKVRGKTEYYVKCLIRGKDIKLKPEEIIRQLLIMKLIEDYQYLSDRISLEHQIHFGQDIKRADIVILDKNDLKTPYIIIETKKPKLKEGKEQLKSYCNATGASMAIWTNGDEIIYYHRKEPNYFKPISDIPKANQSLRDILKEKFTIEDLRKNDISRFRSLKSIILEMEDEVLANAGVDVFEEVFKLIFIKLFDELQNIRELTKSLEFRHYGESDGELKKNMEALFSKAKKKWPGIFKDDDKIELTPSHLAICVSSLQDVKLFNSNLEVIDEAFEYLVNKNSKGEKGQYFTPRYVIDMCVKMLNPQEDEYMIDTAAGSCGFPIHTVFYVWKNIYSDLGIEESHLFTAEKKHPRALEYVKEKVFGIDFDKKAVRVARMLNLIAGDGHTNVLQLNSLDFERWRENIRDEDWQDVYFEGWKRIKKLRAKTKEGENRFFNFDIVMANPPFAGDIKESRILHRYELAKKPNEKSQNKPSKKKSNEKFQSKVGRDILFIERNLNMLKPGGRMAIILPQGRFNNSSDKYIREFIAEQCRILAVIGLHGNVFKPHTGTKTSVLLVQKWDDKLCPRKEDYPIFFATMTKPSKDNSGEKIYLKNEDGDYIRDSHGHLIVEHDLFNHDGITEDGIAEAFIEFAKKEGLSFVGKFESPFNEAKYKALLDGLEAVELKLSEVIRDSEEFRLNSEFFRKEYLDVKNKLLSLNFQYLSQLNSFNSRYKQPQYDDLSNLKVLNSRHLRNDFLDYENSKNGYGEVVPKNAVMINSTGIGTLGRVNINYLEENFSIDNHINVIVAKNINPYYLMSFLQSKYGQSQINRYYSGSSGQIEIYPKNFDNFIIPLFSDFFQSQIENLVKSAHQKHEESKSLYKEAENILLKELDLLDFEPSTENIAIKSFSESFGKTGRLDAEYYQPKYDEVEEKIKKVKYNKLGNLVEIQKSIEPGSDVYQDYGIPFIRVSNLTKFGISEPNTFLPDDFLDDDTLDKLQPKQNTILLSKDGTVGIAYNIKKDSRFITSGAILHLTIKKGIAILPEYLTLVLNSILVKMQSERDAGGSIIQHWKISEIQQVLIPIINYSIQSQIEEKIKKSFELKEKSKQLLDIAKRAVEIAIEQDEKEATEYINSKMS